MTESIEEAVIRVESSKTAPDGQRLTSRTWDRTTCGHEFTRETVCSGSWEYPNGEPGVFIPSPAVCATCHRQQCDACAANDVICSCCGGGICTGCAPGARQRVIVRTPTPRHVATPGQTRSRTEYLCASCAANQDAEKLELSNRISLRSGIGVRFKDSDWLSDIHADLKAALAEAEKALSW